MTLTATCSHALTDPRPPWIWLLILACAGSLIAWNAVPFRAAQPKIRTKELSFLPAAELAGALSFGHANSVSRLRWIDSFAYFQLQLDRRDDSISGGRSGFKRLYDLLIALDPQFAPFYHHAGLNTGAITGRMDLALGYLLRGTMELPHDSEIWRHAASVFQTHYRIMETHPEQFEAFLAAWADAEASDNGRRIIDEWLRTISRRHARGLEQLPYWLDRLAATKPGSSAAEYIEDTLREQLAHYALAELTSIADALRSAGRPIAGLTDLIDPLTVASRRIDLRWGPFAISDGQLGLRSDPYGHPYVWRDGAVVSIGLERARYERALGISGGGLENRAQVEGRFPRDLAEAQAWAGIGEPPAGGRLVLEDHVLRCAFAPPPTEPWPLRTMLAGR
ncbi:MAG: hypothetical protein H0W72_04850 [Planctomycetes bacterium]|nr:hypothetical protein [Planctomycetota bacterium]